MSPTPHGPRTVRRYAWLRVFVVLVALLALGAHTEAVADPALSASASASTGTGTCDTEHDVLDGALRPTAPQGQGGVTPQRPGPRTGDVPSAPAPPSRTLVRPPYSPALRALHTVVLLC
ncbi:hypothetical protein [Streptomyces sp. NPDC007264]|uniref:hypothetical protein n=1 Tax=Streptomyces sp. NPDC007264 TaxID=3364777 RepID=UPI0036DD81A2